MRRRTACQCAWAASGWSGGKGALLGDGLAHDAQCGDEADPVRVVTARGGRPGSSAVRIA